VAHTLGLADYPAEELTRLWQLLLLNQFHDILPGSSIAEVYADTARDHAEVASGAAALRDAALDAIGTDAGAAAPLNCSGFARHEVAETPAGALVFVEAPPYGVGAIVEAPSGVSVEEREEAIVLENAHLRAELGRDGTVRRLVHLETGREALASAGNVLRLYEDRPTDWDAWDVDPFHLETGEDCPPAESCAVATADPLRAEIAFERAIGDASRLRQTVRLDAESRRLEFRAEVDWHESHRFLKVAFPLAVHAHYATYEIQFGAVERPTHFSTSYDLARFEVPGQRFADLSEHGFGVAALTVSTYGYSCIGNELRLSLLRSPKWPDPQADMGFHELEYAVMPHRDGWQSGGVVREAALFNAPIRWISAGTPRSFVSVDDANLVLATVKRAEDSDALVLRLYEAHGGRGRASVRLSLSFTEAYRCNLLEDPQEQLPVAGDTIELAYRPWEIVSLIVR
jgi:alpha-mannosidase